MGKIQVQFKSRYGMISNLVIHATSETDGAGFEGNEWQCIKVPSERLVECCILLYSDQDNVGYPMRLFSRSDHESITSRERDSVHKVALEV